MPETIPLCTTLSIDGQDVIVDYTIGPTSLPDLMNITVSAIAGIGRLVKRPVERDADA